MTATQHWLIVARDEEYLAKHEDDPDDPARTYAIECSDPAACPGWIECLEPHPAAPDPDEYDGDIVVMHGQEHEHRWGYGWTVDYPGCPVQGDALYGDSYLDIARTHGLGRHPIDADWDDTDVHLIALEDPPAVPA